MRHTCPDGTTARLTRDPAAPVGELARHTCPRCGWSQDGVTILRNAHTILRSPFVLRALAAELPTKVLR